VRTVLVQLRHHPIEVTILKAHLRIFAACTALLLVMSTAAPALASTLSGKRAQAAAAQAKISDLQNQEGIATDEYDQARAQYEQLTAQVIVIRERVAALQAQTASLQDALGNQADEMYREGGEMGVISALLSARSIDDLESTIELLARIGDQNAATIAQLKQTEQEVAAEQQKLVAAQTAADEQQTAMAANKAALQAQLTAVQNLKNSLDASIKKILPQPAAAAAAAAAARARAHGIVPGGNPPSNGTVGAKAVWWAEQKLGCWYEWGAAGPSTFDCSGLCMWAYAHVGISLPHYSGAQFNSGPHVSKDNLEPGDLVFFGNPIHHVGMYVGGGDFIEAPYTGVRVRISSLAGRSDFAGATRPQ
jgi:cell wall-associated NlpC family hydrolase